MLKIAVCVSGGGTNLPVSYTHLRAHDTDRSRGLGDVYKRQDCGSDQQ